MAIGWLALLQSVPWSEVISNAPKLADGARKLWNAAGKKPAPPTATDTGTRPAAASASPTIAALQERIVTLEAAVSDLHGQMLASSELIKALAEQNAQLVRRIEAHRLRLRWLSAATALVAIAAGISLFLAS